MFFSAGIAVFLTGVTEPLEFMFMFASPILYGTYALIQGLAFGLADIINLRLHSFGSIELLTRVPISIKAGLTGDLINYVIACIVFFVGTYFIASFLIRKLKIATPGRLGNYDDNDNSENKEVETKEKGDANSQVVAIVELLGGSDNIVDVDACMTRLRVSIKDDSLVGNEEEWKNRELWV